MVISGTGLLDARPVLVRAPRPGRFALHKLWTASQQATAGKDRAQAAALIAVLAALDARRTARRRVLAEVRRLPAEHQAWLA